MELILESPMGVSITVRKPDYKQQAAFLSTLMRDDHDSRINILVDVAEYIALNCIDTDYTDHEIAKKYGVDLLEVQSTTAMATNALVNRYTYGLIALWAENLLDQLALTDDGINRRVETEKNSSAPVERSP